MKISHKRGAFALKGHGKTWDGWLYARSFEWCGETFVVHKSLYSDSVWKTSHRDSGYALSAETAAKTANESIRLALKILRRKGLKQLKAAIRKAKRIERTEPAQTGGR